MHKKSKSSSKDSEKPINIHSIFIQKQNKSNNTLDQVDGLSSGNQSRVRNISIFKIIRGTEAPSNLSSVKKESPLLKSKSTDDTINSDSSQSLSDSDGNKSARSGLDLK